MSENRVEVSCNLCGSQFTDLLHVIDGVRIVQCRVCDLTYLNPRDEVEIAERNRTRNLVAHFAPMARRQRIHFELRLAKILAIAGRPGRLLDVGCAAGAFLTLARELGWKTVGVDVNTLATAYARESLGLDVVTGTLGNLPADRGRFDAVALWDVLEHVVDPRELIGRARDRLKDEGVLALSVPNVASLAAWWAQDRWPMFGDEHFTYFTPETIRKMVRLTGFEVLRVETHGLGRCFLPSGKTRNGPSGALATTYDRSCHRPAMVLAERVTNRLLDLVQAGQVIHLYARRRRSAGAEPRPLQATATGRPGTSSAPGGSG